MENVSSYNFMVLFDFSDLISIKEKWNDLLVESKSKSIFLTWEWMETWCEIYGDRYELMIVLAYDQKNDLVAIAPFKISKRRRWHSRPLSVLEFIGWGERVTPEYLDVIVSRGKEKEILPLLFDYLLEKYKIDAIELKPFNSDSGNLEIIAKHLSAVGGNTLKFKQSKCPVATLPASWSGFMAGKSQNFRKKMKEFDRVFERDTVFSLKVLENSEDLELFWRQFVDLHQCRWGQKSTAFQSQTYLRFHKTVMLRTFEKDWLRLLIAFDGSTPVAAIYCFFYNQTYYYYQSGRDPRYEKFRVGLVMINKTIQKAISEGAEAFDFLTGSEAYKFRWADRVRVNYSLNYYRRKGAYLAFLIPRLLLRAVKRFGNRYQQTIDSKRP